MDKKLMKLVGSTMKGGEKVAPVKSIKLKVKFDKAREEALEKKK
jgi:hypothetical protein